MNTAFVSSLSCISKLKRGDVITVLTKGVTAGTQEQMQFNTNFVWWIFNSQYITVLRIIFIFIVRRIQTPYLRFKNAFLFSNTCFLICSLFTTNNTNFDHHNIIKYKKEQLRYNIKFASISLQNFWSNIVRLF